MINETKLFQVGVNKSVLKEYSKNGARVVYMKNGSEFQINLFNNTQDVISASIMINGKNIKNRLVLNPGERVWLERYLDKPTKFKYETYMVEDNNAEVDAAIANNGEIRVKFYKERTNANVAWLYYDDYYKTTSDPIRYRYIDNNMFNTICDNDSTWVTNLNSNVTSTSLLSKAVATDCAISTTANYFANSTANDDALGLELGSAENCTQKETGRITEGARSSQQFENTVKEWETFPFKIEVISILPESQKEYSVNDTVKCYCHECGRKLKSKYKFCPYCGAEVE